MTHQPTTTNSKQANHKKQISKPTSPTPTPQSIASQLMTIELQDNSITTTLVSAYPTSTLEARLARPLLIRQLYRLLPPPTPKQLPDIYRVSKVSQFDKPAGYTQSIGLTAPYTVSHNRIPGFVPAFSHVYRISHPSATKLSIIKHYEDAGWTITSVSAYNVTAERLERHPDCQSIAVLFTVTRDRATYRYFLITETD